VAVATIGPDLESEVKRLNDRGEVTKGLLMDALGSVCVESAADHIDHQIRREIGRKGLRASTRFSPGYGSFGLEHQRFIFEVVPAHEIGVKLSESLMMVPRKSVSFCLNAGRNPQEIRKKRLCAECDVEGCMKRSDEPGAGC
jgi:cobalamin-dependent methionine synthase I